MCKVAVYGGGVIGLGWTVDFLKANLETAVYMRNPAKIPAAREEVARRLYFFADQNVLTKEEADAYLKKLVISSDLKEVLDGAFLVQENVSERLDVKHDVIKTIESYCPEDAIIASSTSGLRTSDIAEGSKHPERVIVAHPFNPVELIPLVELVKGKETDDAVLKKANEFYKKVGKEPIILQKEVPGMVSNRLQAAIFREAINLVNEGVCSIDEVDRAVCYGPGLRWAFIGPNMVFHLGGGQHGLKGIMTHIGVATKVWLEDMATWTEFPKDFVENANVLMEEALKERDDLHGKTVEEVAKFRDEGLVQLLKYHGKL